MSISIETLTIEQLAQVLYRVNLASRRRAKGYIRQLGLPGDSPTLDSVLARIRNHADFREIDDRSRHIRYTQTMLNCSKDDLKRIKEQERKDIIRAAARENRYEYILAILPDTPASDRWTEPQAQAIERSETAKLDDALSHLQIDYPYDYEHIANKVMIAWADAMEESAIENLQGKSRPGARYALQEMYSKHLSIDSSCDCLEFDDKQDAIDLCCLTGYSGSSYTAEIIDQEEDN